MIFASGVTGPGKNRAERMAALGSRASQPERPALGVSDPSGSGFTQSAGERPPLVESGHCNGDEASAGLGYGKSVCRRRAVCIPSGSM